MNLHMHDLRREAGSRLLERGADLHTVQLFLEHANISTSSRYLKPSKLALHTTIQRIDAQRRESGEAATWEQDLAELRKNLSQGPQKGPHADRIVRQREVGKTVTPPRVNRFGRLAQLVRARASHARGRRFESFSAHHRNVVIHQR